MTTAIFASILSLVLVGRYVLEGLMYNVSFSSQVGDVGLLIVVLIATTILKEGRAIIPKPLQDDYVHGMVLLFSVVLGVGVCVLTIDSRSGQVMDVFHDVIIAPLFLSLAITLLPIIFKNGKKVEVVTTICLILLWAGLVWFDVAHHLLNQREWLYAHISIIRHMKPAYHY
jgi:hypothetical protein